MRNCLLLQPMKTTGMRAAVVLSQITMYYVDIHQHTPYLSITVAQHLLHGSSPLGSIMTPPSLNTRKAL